MAHLTDRAELREIFTVLAARPVRLSHKKSVFAFQFSTVVIASW